MLHWLRILTVWRRFSKTVHLTIECDGFNFYSILVSESRDHLRHFRNLHIQDLGSFFQRVAAPLRGVDSNDGIPKGRKSKVR